MNESSDIGRRRRRARRVRRSADQWASLIAAQADSRMSIVAFCRERGVAVSTFHAWRRRLSGTRAASSSSSSCGFVRLRSGDEPPADGAASDLRGGTPEDGDGEAAVEAGAVVVRFTDGVEVRVDARQLTEVLRCLREGASDTGRG
jgi:hypothetical protein